MCIVNEGKCVTFADPDRCDVVGDAGVGGEHDHAQHGEGGPGEGHQQRHEPHLDQRQTTADRSRYLPNLTSFLPSNFATAMIDSAFLINIDLEQEIWSMFCSAPSNRSCLDPTSGTQSTCRAGSCWWCGKSGARRRCRKCMTAFPPSNRNKNVVNLSYVLFSYWNTILFTWFFKRSKRKGRHSSVVP